MRTKGHMSFLPISIWWIRDRSMQTCSQGVRCAIKLTLLDRFFQTRVGHQKQRNVLITATFSLIGRPNGWSVLPGKPVGIGGRSLIGMGSQACGSGFLSLRVERVLFMINAPRPPRKCLFCAQMNRPLPPSRKRANAKKLQNFGHCTQNEQESKALLRKPCARVRCGERAPLAAKSSGFRHFLRRQPSTFCGRAPG
jgi:hypothetical protein